MQARSIILLLFAICLTYVLGQQQNNNPDYSKSCSDKGAKGADLNNCIARNTYKVYSFTYPDYPVYFAIFAGVIIVLTLGLIFIVVGLLTMDPGKDSIIYRMTTVRMKKD